MNPQLEPHDNVEPRTARPGKAHPVANTEYENSSRQTSPTATLGFVSRPAGSDVDGGPVGSGTLRKPQVDEEYVMEEFERHTDHCIKCSPTPDKLCSKGYGDGLNCQGYAFDVIEYLCCINDQVYSLVDRSQVRVCKSQVIVWSLLRTMENGLRFDGITKGKLEKVERHIREVKNGLQGRGWVGGKEDGTAAVHGDSGNLGNTRGSLYGTIAFLFMSCKLVVQQRNHISLTH